jgi:calcipressin-2
MDGMSFSLYPGAPPFLIRLIRDIVFRVYRADPSPVNALPDHLRPPELEKNFLISPPGSPPVGWEQIKEEAPNSAPLADDLMVALRKLASRQRSKRDSVEILIQPEDAGGVGVYLEDCDGAEDDDDDDKPAVDWAYGEDPPLRSKWAYAPTAMPPRPVA